MKLKKSLSLLLIIFLTVGCGKTLLDGKSSSGSGVDTTSSNIVGIIDPNQSTGLNFGSLATQLTNGNIVVRAKESSTGLNNGAIYLYNLTTKTLIASIVGDDTNDSLGVGGIFPLSNGNFVIASSLDDHAGLANVGSVMLVDGTTGAIINTIRGDQGGDSLSQSFGGYGITQVGTSNFVISSYIDSDGSFTHAGSVILVDGATGSILSELKGTKSFENVGWETNVLSNGNYVVTATGTDNGGTTIAGSIRILSGNTGSVLATVYGQSFGERLGWSDTAILNNDNIIAGSSTFSSGGFVYSATLINGTTGAVINRVVSNDLAIPRFLALPNNNVLVTSPGGGGSTRGNIMLLNGVTGASIVSINGDHAGDRLGLRAQALTNSNIVLSSGHDDDGAIVDAGSVLLMNGSTGAIIMTTRGDQANDQLGSQGIATLPNNNFIVNSPYDDDGTLNDAGSVILFDGTTGASIVTIRGDQANDQIGSGGTKALSNDNFVISSPLDDDGILVDAGSVALIDGSTGGSISTLHGDYVNDQLGNKGVTSLSNSNYVITSTLADNGSITDAGSVTLMDGSNGSTIRNDRGDQTNDQLGNSGITEITGDRFLIASKEDDVNGIIDAGSILIRTSN